jgi:hypothetical protein
VRPVGTHEEDTMRRRVGWSVFLIACGLVLWPAGTAVSQSMQEVVVRNFPQVQQVEGRVSVDGPVPLSSVARRDGIIVAPVSPRDTTRLIDAGTIETAGFGHVTLSLIGTTKGEVGRSGSVGAILIPDEDRVRQAFDESGETLFALTVEAAGVSSASAHFASSQPRFQIGFPRYRVFLFNTSDKAADVDLVAYLTP